MDVSGVGALLASSGVDPRGVSFEQLELLKKDLYAGKPHAVRRGSGIIQLGQSANEKKALRHAMLSYSDAVWQALQAELDDPGFVVLTGGGVAIETVRKEVTSRLASIGVKQIVYAQRCDKDLMVRGHSAGPNGWEAAPDAGRVATALGASSVALGYFPDRVAKRYQPRGVFW